MPTGWDMPAIRMSIIPLASLAPMLLDERKVALIEDENGDAVAFSTSRQTSPPLDLPSAADGESSHGDLRRRIRVCPPAGAGEGAAVSGQVVSDFIVASK